ncbi:MAG: hypothetical protein V4591_06000 [Bdellovibrionota bacterium]
MKNKLIPYDELGFRIYLLNPPFIELPNGEKVPSPNMKQLQKIVFNALSEKKSRFTGDEIRFIRKYLRKTQVEFSKWLNMSNHSVISQWENKENKLSGMDYNTEILLRLQMIAAETNSLPISIIEDLKHLSRTSKPLEIELYAA